MLKVNSKLTLMESIKAIDSSIMRNASFDKDAYTRETIDASLLPAYLHVFNGKVGEYNQTENPNITDNVQEAYKSMKRFNRGDKMNGKALRYFLHQQSMLIHEIPSSFSELPDINKMLYDGNDNMYYQDQYLREKSSVTGENMNYLASIKFMRDQI